MCWHFPWPKCPWPKCPTFEQTGADPGFLERGFIYITMRVFKYPMKRKLFGLNETKLVHFHGIFENGGGGGGVDRMQVLAPRL